jgi:hypothetical protein
VAFFVLEGTYFIAIGSDELFGAAPQEEIAFSLIEGNEANDFYLELPLNELVNFSAFLDAFF